MFKKILSYLYPIKVGERKSDISGQLELTLQNGILTLDSQHTNYSYGSVSHILYYGLKKVGIKRVKEMKNILLLGVGAGCIIELLQKIVGYKGQITGVELDPEIIKIATQHFGIDKVKNLTLHLADAQEYVQQPNLPHYDLIIIDIFQDDLMPPFLFTETFIDNVVKLLTPQGALLHNTIRVTPAAETRNEAFWTMLNKHYNVQRFQKVEGTNELFLIEKQK